ncbi:ATP-binding protein [Pelagicoccus sp. SDUM812003]|uniref:ATP-binding protein n=1 Tax=Pelagicoccus sp. SDUM812003 TaxID=3041267 RepID=UPI00280E8FD8|nr:ATP-binding protein [Pelagicoccus sp. SDUM812003]MDQ8201377.1 ATP-binding protein [Pelagicoccus sp. SDUM812003]
MDSPSQENSRLLSRQFSELSLRKKLSIIISSVSLLVVSLSMLTSFLIEFGFFRTRLLEEYQASARIIATNLETSVVFDEVYDARDMISAFRQREYVITAVVYTRDGSILAAYERNPSSDDTERLIPPFDVESGLEGNALYVNVPVMSDGIEIGRVALHAELGELSSFLVARAWIFAALLLLSVSLAIILATKLGRKVSQPILELAKTARRITTENDFSKRQPRLANDETGTLVDAFNEMMETIQSREAEILLAKENAEASSRAKDDFLSVISHELRTPLNPIIGYVEILERKLNKQEDKRQIALVKQYAEHLQKLIGNVIDYSRFERGAVSFSPEPVDYCRLCQNALILLSQSAAEKGIDLTFEHHFDPPELEQTRTLSIDRTKLQQVVLNIISNSIKFTEKGSVVLKTHLRRRGERHRLRIEVTDTGIGIDSTDREKVFQPFTQLNEGLSSEYGGMGLGLAITRKIVEAMGGSLDFESEKDYGSCFWFELPVELSAESDPDPELEPLTPIQQSKSDKRILLVDDQLVNLELGESMLNSCGHRVARARNGKEAVKLAEQEDFSLIIMDIKMPRMDGYETSRAIRSSDNPNKNTPIIAMTAHVTTRGSELSYESGMDDFLSKPFDTANLNHILKKWLGATSSRG